jgi:hypothetical protein
MFDRIIGAAMRQTSLFCGSPAGPLARILPQLVRKIGQGLDCLEDFPKAWNNGVYFQLRKILQAIKD